ncbi:MAG TPA: GspH/FimT family pseudopilin [Gemmatimonadaceae bacterium]|nr:GspH/FimT family pseudopilin [Gemmatimonadaceae bacterium]
MRRTRAAGHTVTELIVVLMIVGVLLAVAVPRVQRVLDRITVHGAATDVAQALGSARALAIAGHASVAVDLDSLSGVLRVRRGTELLLSRNIGSLHDVTLTRSRDSLTYDGRGLGRGAANLSIVVHRRTAAETVFVSRFGRVR